MSTIFLGADAETYYDSKTYSLARRDTTTQQYVEDERAETIGWGFAELNKNQPQWIAGKADGVISAMPWDRIAMIAHNAQFDGSWLEHHYGVRPKHVLCTMAMAQALGIGKLTGSVSLATLARFFRLPDKGTEVLNANGKRLRDFTPYELQQYGEYCKHDVFLTNSIFNIMAPHFDLEEMMWHSKVNKAFTEPQCRLDMDVLTTELARVRARNLEIQQRTADQLDCSIETLKKTLGSNIKFAALLEEHGIAPPMKVSKTTGKDTFAFAKTDKGFIALLEHEDEEIQALAAARLGVKSTTEETRLLRMISLAELPSNKLRIPLKISGAHTHRASGKDGLNFQNFPSGRVEGQSKALRRSITALPGQYLTAPDSGQIEARILAFMANDTELLGLFSRGECPYSAQAEVIYSTPREEIYAGAKAYGGGDKSKFDYYMMRQTGKAAILQLGYQAGVKGFFVSLTGTYRVTTVDQQQAERIVAVYRESRAPIVEFWQECETVLASMMRGGKGHFGGPDGKLFYYDGRKDWFGYTVPSVKLPNNTWLTYPDLQEIKDGWRTQKIYIQDRRKFKRSVDKNGLQETLHKHGKRIYGGSFTENLCQALAFAALKWQALRMDAKFISNVHDEHIMAIDAPEEAKELQAAMMETPPYLEGLKFDCEYEVANNYAEC